MLWNKSYQMGMTMTNLSAKRRLLHHLLGTEGESLLDIKFFRGTADVISEEEFCCAVLSALEEANAPDAQISRTFREDLHVVDVRELCRA